MLRYTELDGFFVSIYEYVIRGFEMCKTKSADFVELGLREMNEQR